MHNSMANAADPKPFININKYFYEVRKNTSAFLYGLFSEVR